MKHALISLAIFCVGVAGFAQTPTDQFTYPASMTEGTTGTVTVSYEDFGGAGQSRSLRVLTLAFTSDSGGDAVAVVPSQYGTIARVVTIPAGGDAAPSDNWGVTLTDRDGIDVLAGKGANRDEANSESFVPLIGDGVTTDQLVTVAGELTLAVSGAGAANSGVIRIYLK